MLPIIKNFMAEWLGKRIDTDGVPVGALYQCVDLIKQYAHEVFGVAFGAYGNAINYWTTTAAAILAKFDKIAGSGAQAGDIVVLNGLPGNPDGHVGIATGNINATQVEILEQNGHTGNGSGEGEDAIRTRYVDRSRVAGLLRPKTAPSPVAAPSAAATASAPQPTSVNVRVIGSSTMHYNVRTSPQIANNVRRDGYALGGQQYAAQIVAGGWAQISFRGSVGYLGPAAFTRV